MKKIALLAATMMLPFPAFAQMSFPTGAIASRPLPAAMLSNGARLKEGIAALNRQWEEQTGQPLLTDDDLKTDPAAAAKAAQARQQDDEDDEDADENNLDPQAAKRHRKAARLKQQLQQASQGSDDFTPAKIGDRYKIPVGYIARATLEITANSDHPGSVKGMLTLPILSIDRQHVLFPAGSVVTGKIVGTGSGTNSIISERAVFVPQYIVQPDGGAMHITGQEMMDRYGINGIGDQTNYHIAPMLAAVVGLAAVESLPSVLSNLSQKQNTFNTVGENGAQYLQQGGQTTLQQYMSLRPTVTVRGGRVPFLIFFNHEQFAPEYRATDNFNLTNVQYQGAGR
ncbi:TrbI/VirB10 family protein [Gluconobacter sp. Dm-44]|uniref:TrbI/VirB10 family protein n=1 Tax=Gluconobacter sp. Dm-44 TaxID=2799805 RepID=UPI001B8D6871|nr:TrbI/VirB10 family protein [Gluconobacter sp. Dm-44]MBS1061152.1 conjugal transfer protein [Gluconobacter sp. Dm-44]